MCLCAFFCMFATAYCHLVCRPLSSRIEGAKSSAITVFRPFYSWFAFCSSQPSLPAFIIGWVALSFLVPLFVVLPNVVTFILLLSLVSFPPRVSWLRSSHPCQLITKHPFLACCCCMLCQYGNKSILCFFFKAVLIFNNLLGVGMLSYSERVGAVCRASTESRPRDVAAETHALLPSGCRITPLRIGWTKTTRIWFNII